MFNRSNFHTFTHLLYDLCLATFPNIKKKTENTTCSGVFLTNLEVFGNVIKNYFDCLIYLLRRNYRAKEKWRNKEMAKDRRGHDLICLYFQSS